MIKGGRSQVSLCRFTSVYDYVSRLGRLFETSLMTLVITSSAANLKMEHFGSQEIRPASPAVVWWRNGFTIGFIYWRLPLEIGMLCSPSHHPR